MFETATFLLAIVAIFIILALISFSLSYLLLLRKLTRRMETTVAEMHTLVASAIVADARTQQNEQSIVPPMRLHLEHSKRGLELFGKFGARADRWLLDHSFATIGQYVIEELGFEEIRTYLSDDRNLIAAIRLPLSANEPYVEFCFKLAGSTRGGVSNPPGPVVAPPAEAAGKFYQARLSEDASLLSKMWLDAKEFVDSNSVVPFEADGIASFFEEAHAAEMDYLIEQGGISEKEIRSTLLAHGVEPSQSDIDDIQAEWQTAIENHLLDFSSQGKNHQLDGHDVLVVHDGSANNYLLGRLESCLAKTADSARDDLAKTRELAAMLKLFSPREALSRFRPFLPIDSRYEMIDQVQYPIQADLYLLPADPNS